MLIPSTGCYLVNKSCPPLLRPTDCSPPGSSVHGILQARVLERVAISFPRGSPQSRDRTHVSCIRGRFFTTEPPGKPFCWLLISFFLKSKFQRSSSYCLVMLSETNYSFNKQFLSTQYNKIPAMT